MTSNSATLPCRYAHGNTIHAVEDDGLFNDYTRRSRPLSMKMRSYSDALRNRLNSLPLAEVSKLDRQQVAEIVASVRCAPISLGEPTEGWGGPFTPRRYWAALPLVEGEDFVHFWPDQIEGIEPIDLNDSSKADQWQFGLVEGSPTGVGIITAIDLSKEEHDAELANPTLQGRLDERMDTAKQYVAALARQMVWFFNDALVEQGMEIVTERQKNLSIVQSLAFPSTWRVPEPKIVAEAETESAGQPTETGPTESSNETGNGESPGTEHTVPYRQRLDPASFKDVQRITRIWADSVERYPDAFGVLGEDRISDLLTATLNATLPGAQREVYTRAGKSDIFIQADKLSEGAGPAKIFICESKWATGSAVVAGAVDPQLFGYLSAHDTSAILLLLFSQKHFARARTNAYRWLREVDGYIGEEVSSVDGWPIFAYQYEDYTVHLCIASVHLG